MAFFHLSHAGEISSTKSPLSIKVQIVSQSRRAVNSQNQVGTSTKSIPSLFSDDIVQLSVLIENNNNINEYDGDKDEDETPSIQPEALKPIIGSVSLVIEQEQSVFDDRTIRYLEIPLNKHKSINFSTAIPLSHSYIGQKPYEIIAKLDDWNVQSEPTMFIVKQRGTLLEIVENYAKTVLSLIILVGMSFGSFWSARIILEYFDWIPKRTMKTTSSKKNVSTTNDHLDSYLKFNQKLSTS